MSGLGFVTTVSVGVLILTSGAAKLLLGGFTSDLANYRLLPRASIPVVASLLPWLEILVGVAVLSLPQPASALLLAAFLLAVYTAAVATNLLRGRRVPCGCHGSSRPISWKLATSDIGWTLVALAAAWLATSPVAVLVSANDKLSATDGLALLLTLVTAAAIARTAIAAERVRTAVDRVERILQAGAS